MDLHKLPDVIIDLIYSYVIFTPPGKNKLRQAVNMWYTNMKLCYKLYGHISSWNTKYVINMKNLFKNYKKFNSIISTWDVSNVINMRGMFENTGFNQSLNNWDVSKVTDMSYMFGSATFNKPLDNWNVCKVTNMEGMFRYASSFNQSLDNWDVSNLIYMDCMIDSVINYTTFIYTDVNGLEPPSWYIGKIIDLL